MIQQTRVIFSVFFAAIFCFTISCGAKAQQVGKSPSILFTAKDVFNLEYAADPQISPDGKSVVYVRRSNDIMSDRTRSNLWIVSVDGQSHRPLLSSIDNYSSPRWSPTGDRLAYISAFEGRGAQIYIRYMDTGVTARLTELERAPRSLTWSPDGEKLAFVMDVPEPSKAIISPRKKPKGATWAPAAKVITSVIYRFNGRGFFDPLNPQVFTVSAEGGTARQITTGRHGFSGGVRFSSDGSQLYYATNRRADWEFDRVEKDIYAVDLSTLVETQITSRKGAETNARISPDGKRLAWLQAEIADNPYRTRRLVVAKADGSEPAILTEDLDRTLDSLDWVGNTKLVAHYVDRGKVIISLFDLKGRETKITSEVGGTSLGRPYTSGSYSASINGTIAFTHGTSLRPADLAVIRSNAAPKVLTDLNEDVLGDLSLGAVREIKYPSSFDGTEIQGWYLLPPDYVEGQAYPTILELHGGPHLGYGPHFSAEMQLMAAKGYVIFYPNYRGSKGYGEAFALLLKYKYSSPDDFADNMSGIDALIEMGIADPEHLYITGGSAGGISSAYAIGLTDRFRAAAVAKPVINWISKTLTGDSYISQIRHQFPGMPWDEFEHYWKRSPLSLVGNVVTPTMLLTGEEDWRTPISETEQFYQALKLKGVDTAMVRFPGSPHGIAGRPSRLISKVDHILAWFEQYGPQSKE